MVPLTEDVKRTLVHLINIVTSYEADRFSISLLYKAGLGIPFSLLTAAHSFYRSWSRGENIGAVLMAGFPLYAQALLPHSGQLLLLANYIKNQIEDWVGADSLPFPAGYGEPSENVYLGLGILALLGEYYLAGHTVPPPKRAGLKLPVTLAQLFSRICRYWHILCAASAADDAPSTDTFGRMALNAAEKREQREGRTLARFWAGDIYHRQIGMERLAQSYYGIEKPVLPAKKASSIKDRGRHPPALSAGTTPSLRDVSFTSFIAPAGRVLHALERGLLFALMPFPAVSGTPSTPSFAVSPSPETVSIDPVRAAKLNLSSGALVPPEITTVNDYYPGPRLTTLFTQLHQHLLQRYPAISNMMAQRMTESISRHFGIVLNPDSCYLQRFERPCPDPCPSAGRGQGSMQVRPLTLTDLCLRTYFTDELDSLAALDDDYGFYRDDGGAPDSYRHNPLSLRPSDLDQLLDKLDLPDVYQHELYHFWQDNYKFHVLATFHNVLYALVRHKKRLTPQDIDLYMQALGFSDAGRYRVKISLFDINGYLATDIAVIEAQGLPGMSLYLPRAHLPFQRFANSADMREWIITQSRDRLLRQNILDHFPLRDRADSGFIFGRWGVEHWLEAIADYPEHIWQKKENVSGRLYEILAHRQRERTLADAAHLPQFRRSLPGNKNVETVPWINGLYALPLTPSITITRREAHRSSPHPPPAHPPFIPDSVQSALSLMTSAAGEILPCDDNGIIQFSAGPKIALSLFQSIINYDLQAGKISRNATGGEARILEALSIMPEGYVRTHRRWPNGRIDMHFSITLRLADGQRRENLPAIRMFDKILPLRFNTRLKAYEIYDIHHGGKVGYPVCLNAENHWQFGRLTGHKYHERTAVSMAIYSHISIRLYEVLTKNLNDLCKSVTDITPVNSMGIVQDADGIEYLTMNNHYFEMNKGPAERVFLLRGDNNVELRIKLDNKKRRFFYIPGSVSAPIPKEPIPKENPLASETVINATDSRLSYRQGFRLSENTSSLLALAAEKKLVYSGLKKIIYYGLSEQEIALDPRYSPQANAMGKALAHCDAIVRELASKREHSALRDALFAALHISDAGPNPQYRAWSLFNNNLEKLLALLDSHTGDGYRRIWGASFDPFTTALIAQKSDPLKRIWFNVRFRQPKGPHSHYLAQYCHYGCKEIPLEENTASVSRSTDKDPVGEDELFVNPVFKDDFPKLIGRLKEGSMRSNEINSLVSLPEAGNIQYLAFLSDRKLAKRLFRTKATARIKMILTDADRFSHLLLHLHATLSDRSCEHPYQDSVRMTLYMLAWQGL
ncbi:DUF6543 domain-containing protein [Sodalis sp. dw_96]|uniref:dermonecrotic toxin domain-containing protein n=1 Tax=Sodalis sp. dw_96 TaxID=2719794 RepID=UPI001BD2D15C|nr:DUF6543 domain-containing protein [Sodalis sp. dw_96]